MLPSCQGLACEHGQIGLTGCRHDAIALGRTVLSVGKLVPTTSPCRSTFLGSGLHSNESFLQRLEKIHHHPAHTVLSSTHNPSDVL